MAIVATASPIAAKHPHPVRTEAASPGAARPTVSGHGDRRQGRRPSLPGTRGGEPFRLSIVRYNGSKGSPSIVRYNWPKKFFSSHCTIQLAQKVFFKPLDDTISPKSFFQAIVRYNWPKKFFSSHCTIQSAQKVFFKRLYDTISPKSFFHVIVRYNEPKGGLAIVQYNGHKGGLSIVSYNRPRQRPSPSFRF